MLAGQGKVMMCCSQVMATNLFTYNVSSFTQGGERAGGMVGRGVAGVGGRNGMGGGMVAGVGGGVFLMILTRHKSTTGQLPLTVYFFEYVITIQADYTIASLIYLHLMNYMFYSTKLIVHIRLRAIQNNSFC